jgi:hypothetical protein
MSGRGAAIRVRLPVTGEEHSLTVGLHTPLGIFRAQLAQLTGIAVRARLLTWRRRASRPVAPAALGRRCRAMPACRAGVCLPRADALFAAAALPGVAAA